MNTVQGSFVRRFATLDSRPPQAGQCPHEIFVLKNGIRAPVSFAEFDEWLGRGDLRRVAVASRSAGKGEIDFDVRFDGKPRTLPRVNGAFDDRTFMISDDDYRISMQERARVGDETRGFSISDGYFSMPGGAELAYVIRRYGC